MCAADRRKCLLVALAIVLLHGLCLLGGQEAHARRHKSASRVSHSHKSTRTTRRSSVSRRRSSRRATGRRAAAAKASPAKTKGKPPAGKSPGTATASPAPAGKAKPGAEAEKPAAPPDKSLLVRAYALRDRALNEKLRGDYGLAVKHLIESTQLTSQYYAKPSPVETLLYMDLGAAAESAGSNEVARQAYLQCVGRSPSSPEVRLRLAQLLARMGQSSDAIAEARKAIELGPADPRAHHLLSLLLERKGETQEANLARERSRALLEARPPARSEPPEPLSEDADARPADGQKTAEPDVLEDEPLGLP